ncbi:MAG: NAD-dependent protein deacylase [Bacilli bacterium]|nr:NAD-dependent protein deacylase [Bacilli bacterium]
MKKIEMLQKMIDESNNIVFFGGAGVSTASGIKDFRSKDGLYNMKYKWPPELILSSGFFYDKTKDFYDFYRDKLNCLGKEPNIVHKYLYELEKRGKLKAIVTQNIDGLHQKAGNKNIYELHGTIYKNHCIKCNKFYDAEYVFNSKDIPRCKCGGLIKPDVVLYGEMLPEDDFSNAQYAIAHADMLIVAGTSLTVYPASGMINYFRGKHLVLLNRSKTDYDNKADLVIHDDLKEIFKELK